MSLPERIRYFTTVGDNDSEIQAFYNNYWAESYGGRVPLFSQTIPSYVTIGGTLDYYGQNPLSVFTNLSRPFIRYTFTGSTSATTLNPGSLLRSLLTKFTRLYWSETIVEACPPPNSSA